LFFLGALASATYSFSVLPFLETDWFDYYLFFLALKAFSVLCSF
jgi:hypothetical protein